MRRRVARLVLLLALGAIVNVAVAWGLLVMPRSLRWEESTITPPPFATELLAASPRWKKDGGPYFERFRETGYCVLVINDTSAVAQQFTYASAGLPTMALDGARITTGPIPFLPGVATPVESSTGTIESRMRWKSGFESFLPIRPIWPGFAINTIFYAAVLWLLFAAPGMVKRRIRRVRGQCLHCGYDLRGQPPDSEKCPECGQNQNMHTQKRRNAETVQ